MEHWRETAKPPSGVLKESMTFLTEVLKTERRKSAKLIYTMMGDQASDERKLKDALVRTLSWMRDTFVECIPGIPISICIESLGHHGARLDRSCLLVVRDVDYVIGGRVSRSRPASSTCTTGPQ